jgi:hypothetical protein
MRDEGLGEKASIAPANNVSGLLPALVVLLILLSACGYRFTPVGGILPEDAKTIAILTFVNGTMEPYVDVEMTKAVVDEFLSDGRLKVVGSEAADLVLRGTVTKFEITPSAYSTDDYVQSYTVSIGVNVSVEDVKTNKLILRETGVGSVFNSGYGVSILDVTATKLAKETALKNASRDVASTLRSRLLEGF